MAARQPGGFPEPGKYSERQFSHYNPYQQALWEAFDLVYYARENGFANCLQPDPDMPIDTDRYAAWKEKIQSVWDSEATRDSGTRGLGPADFPENVLQYWFQRQIAAESLKKE